MAVARQDLEAVAKILVDGLGLGRRFDDDDVHGPCSSVVLAGRVEVARWPATCSPPAFSPRAGRRGCRADARCGPPSSSSSRASCTSGAAASHSRISSSTASGDGPERGHDAVGQGVSGARRAVSAEASGRRSRQTHRPRAGGSSSAQQRAERPPARRRRSPPGAPRRAAAGWCPDGAGPGGCPAPPSPRGHSSAARRAVISEPEAGAASTTTTPSASPAMIRLRRGKSLARAIAPSGRSLTTAPSASDPLHQRGVLRRVGDVDAGGDHGDRGAAGGERALVRRRVDAAGEARDHDEAARRQLRRERAARTAQPLPLALRAPTIATAGCSNSPGSPRTESTGGASGRLRRLSG